MKPCGIYYRLFHVAVVREDPPSCWRWLAGIWCIGQRRASWHQSNLMCILMDGMRKNKGYLSSNLNMTDNTAVLPLQFWCFNPFPPRFLIFSCLFTTSFRTRATSEPLSLWTNRWTDGTSSYEHPDNSPEKNTNRCFSVLFCFGDTSNTATEESSLAKFACDGGVSSEIQKEEEEEGKSAGQAYLPGEQQPHYGEEYGQNEEYVGGAHHCVVGELIWLSSHLVDVEADWEYEGSHAEQDHCDGGNKKKSINTLSRPETPKQGSMRIWKNVKMLQHLNTWRVHEN